MVNILNFWPKEKDVPAYTKTQANKIVERRLKVSTGFNKLEQEQGHFPQNVDLAMPDTQDYMRLTAFRFLEELCEALEAEETEHYLEELIDAVNYLINMATLDLKYITLEEVADKLDEVLSYGHWDKKYLQDDFANIVIELAGGLGETLRNRSWMVQAQDTMWAGKKQFVRLFKNILISIVSEFPSWAEFYKYFVAKDDVLSFRLETKY